MAETSTGREEIPSGDGEFAADVKGRIGASQRRAVRTVNSSLIELYWQIGSDLLERERKDGWGNAVVGRLAFDLSREFPDMKQSFTATNLNHMKAFAEAWPREDGARAIGEQAVGQLTWAHNIALLTKLDDREARLSYADEAIRQGWSPTELGADRGQP